jgi:Holliday junction resolvase
LQLPPMPEEEARISSKARLVLDASERLKWSDAAKVAQLVKRLERGLPAEDELCVLFRWLGRCKLVHKLDQFPYPPDLWKQYRAPDLLAAFDVEGRLHPVLIEVKTKAKEALSWRPDYLGALQSYADLLKLPLLIAWKHHTFWTLFEAKHMRVSRKNFKMTFEDAMRQNLFGILAGDFSFSFRTGTGLHIRFRKLGSTADGFHGVIEEAYMSNPEGHRHNGGGGIMLLFTCLEQESSLVETDTDALQSFVIENQTSEFAHRALGRLLGVFTKKPTSWRQVLQREQLPLLSVGPRQAAQNALDAGFLRYGLNQRPVTMPEFLMRQDTGDTPLPPA